MRITFFGSSKFVLPILEILRKNFDLALVITTEKAPPEPVINYCTTYNISYLSITNFSDKKVRSQLLEVSSELAVVADFGLIIPPKIINTFPKGILNIHPSLLPKYRGPTPVQTAILNGDKITGVTIIKLDEEIDHGPILRQAQEKILPTDTAETLYERLFKIGAKLLPQTINQYIEGQIKTSPQNDAKATFTKRLTRQDGFFEVNNPPKPEILERMIKAYHPWPGVWTRAIINNKSSIVKFLPEKKLQVEGKKAMTYKDFINGYPGVKEVLRFKF